MKIYRGLKKAYGPQHWWPANTRFEVIVGAILTQNTTWSNVEHAIRNLKSARLLSVRRMSSISKAVLARHLRPAGYFNLKAGRLKNFLNLLSHRYRGHLRKLFNQSVRSLRKELLGVNGIGPETADSIILYAAEKPIFVVDAYTKRVFSRIGVLKSSLAYEEIQEYFMKKLPLNVRVFNEYHALIVEHAKRLCRAKPFCEACAIRSRCRYYKKLS